jgi:hypothetical protein
MSLPAAQPDAKAGDDVGQHRGQDHLAQQLQPRRAQRQGRVHEHLRDRPHADQRVVEHREEDDIGQRDQDRLEPVAEPDDEDRDPGDLDDREQEIDRRRQRPVGKAADPDREATGDAEHGADRDAARVAPDAVDEIDRQDPLRDQVEKGAPDIGGCRIEIGLEPDQRDGGLPQGEEQDETQRPLCRPCEAAGQGQGRRGEHGAHSHFHRATPSIQ